MIEPAQDYLKECFNYDPDTGVLTWKDRPREHFKYEYSWLWVNNEYAGSQAGCNSHGYLQVGICGNSYLVHRVIWCLMTGGWPTGIDHIDHDKMNNRFSNLREATHLDNNKNASRRIDNKSGVTGVSWHSRDKKWQAQIGVGGKQTNLGFFDEKLTAIFARWAAEEKHGFHKNHGATISRQCLQIRSLSSFQMTKGEE